MPFESEKQRRYMWMKHPSIAKRWADEYPNQHDLPMHKHKKKKHEKKSEYLLSLPLLKIAEDQQQGPPNYRPAGDPTRSCGACSHFNAGSCDRYSVPVDEHATCDSFSPIQIGAGPLGQLSHVIAPATPVGPEGPADPVQSLDITPNQATKLNTEQAFKAGFLMRCAEEGLTLDQINERIEMALSLEKQGIWGAVKPIVSGATNVAIGAGIGIPIAVGALTGYTAAKANSDIDSDIEKVKKEELRDTYEYLAEDAEHRAKLKRKAMGLPVHAPLLVMKDNNGLRKSISEA